METLKPSNMIKNHKLAKHISDASWYEFARQVEYKSLWYNLPVRAFISIETIHDKDNNCP